MTAPDRSIHSEEIELLKDEVPREQSINTDGSGYTGEKQNAPTRGGLAPAWMIRNCKTCN